jgi:hypothetical protein
VAHPAVPAPAGGDGEAGVTRDEKLKQLAATAAGVCFGMAAFDDRLKEMAAGIPARAQGPGPKGDHSDPTWRAFDKPGQAAGSNLNAKVDAAYAAIEDLYAAYAALAQPKRGIEKLTDPGCEWCTQAAADPKSPKPDHRCEVYGHITIEVAGKKTRVRVCEWCYRFWLPSRADRPPTTAELWAHALGQRVYLKAKKPAKLKAGTPVRKSGTPKRMATTAS